MLGYIVPGLVIVAATAGAQLTFERIWMTLLIGVMVALLLPVGDLRGKPLILRLVGLPETLRSQKRRKRRRHAYYRP